MTEQVPGAPAGSRVCVRQAGPEDLAALLVLYAELGSAVPAPERAGAVWARICGDPAQHVLLGEVGGAAAASCTLVVVPNLTHGGRPYGLIENVVTHSAYRRRGCALAVLEHAKALAVQAGCYKLMLLTGGKHPGALALYERAGYNRRDKTAFVQWLD